MSTSVSWERARVELERERRRRKAESSNLTGNDAEFLRCSADPAHFIDNFVIIDDAQGDGLGVMPFRLWEDQRSALDHLRDDRLVIFLKARQLGISWLCLGYALWLMAFHPGKVVLLFSQGETEALEMLRRLKAMYERLPEWMLGRLPSRVRDNTSEQGWANGSWCKSMPATKRAGRSFTASLVIMDEAAHQQYGGKLYAALKPTIDAGGKLFVVSSANGSDGFFDVLWEKAEGGINDFRPIFLPWGSRPGRDQAWYDKQVAESTDPELVKQEYPANSREAFVSSGRTRFHPTWVAQQHPHLEVSAIPRNQPGYPRTVAHDDGLIVYSPPIQGRKYVVSADVAEGVEGGDYSTGIVIDRETKTEHACYHGLWEPGDFAVRLDELSNAYDADVVVERNNHGHAVLLKLRELKNRRIADGPDGKPGWLTNAQTKPQAIDLLAEALRDKAIVVHSRPTIAEMQAYTVLSGGKTSAPPGKHDDRVMSWAIAVAWLRLCVRNRSLSFGDNPLSGYRG